MYESYIIKEERELNIVPNPWRRYFARSLDMSLYGLIIMVIMLYGFRINNGGNSWARFVELSMASVLMIVIEPLLLSTLGTTPGKWIFGLVLRDRKHNKITYLAGLWRTLHLFVAGYGLNIPIVNIYTGYKSYRTCADKIELQWDDDFSYELKDKKNIRSAGYIGGAIIIFALAFVIASYARLPIHRGNITSEAYYENCNDFMSIHQLDNGYLINAQGEWYKKPSKGNYIVNFIGGKPLSHQVVYKNGSIQKVMIEYETTKDDWIYSFGNQLYMSYSSFVGADKSLNTFEVYDSDITSNFENSFKDFEFEIDGYKITNTVEHIGFQGHDWILIPEENKERHFQLSFVIERK